MRLPSIQGPNRAKPLCYDRSRDKYITFDDILNGQEPIFPVEELTPEEQKRLVVERQRRGPDYTRQAISGAPMSRDEVVRAIERDDPAVRPDVEADLSLVRDILSQLRDYLAQE